MGLVAFCPAGTKIKRVYILEAVPSTCSFSEVAIWTPHLIESSFGPQDSDPLCKILDLLTYLKRPVDRFLSFRSSPVYRTHTDTQTTLHATRVVLHRIRVHRQIETRHD